MDTRFWSKIEISGEHWLWHGCIKNGYGWINRNYKTQFVHRYVYNQLIGNIPEGLEIDHLCRVRNCVNPYHLEAVTKRVNILRGNGTGAINARKTHCSNGHEFKHRHKATGYKYCRICLTNAGRRWRNNRREVSLVGV